MNTDLAKLNRSIEEIPNAEDREISRAMAILLIATEIGPNAERLAEATGYPKSFIDRIAMNLQEAGLWVNGMVDDREWLDSSGEPIGVRLFAHAQVALGHSKRYRTHTGYLYIDSATGEPVAEWKDVEELS